MLPDNTPNSPKDMHAKAVQHAAALEAWLLPLFQKAPHLPASAKQILVDVAPWISLISGALGIVGILSASAFMSMLFSFAFVTGGLLPIFFTAGMLLWLAGSLLSLLAYKPLSEKKKLGWNYMFYSSLLSVVAFILQMIAGQGMFGYVIALLIGFWLLFEVRDQYSA